jgi:hypothetical protein
MKTSSIKLEFRWRWRKYLEIPKGKSRPYTSLHYTSLAPSKYWRNNPVELGPSLSGFLDKFASFPRLVCQTNVLNRKPFT